MSPRFGCLVGFLFPALLLGLAPRLAWAQGASIAGNVTDATGGVLPGVTVEAASPALIEGSRQTVTDGRGRYLLTELRPGIYTVSFSLVGFNATIRQGIELTTGFTATVDMQLVVGSVQESVTVSGASPVVDVRSVGTQSVTTRETIDTLPSGRNAEYFGRLIPGASGGAQNPDVGGSAGMQRQNLSWRGSSETVLLTDGFRTQVAQGATGSNDFYNNSAYQEMQYQTGGNSADGPGGGMKVNMVPKEGGNAFSGSLYGDYTGSACSTPS